MEGNLYERLLHHLFRGGGVQPLTQVMSLRDAKFLIYYGLNFHYVLFAIAFLFRYNRFKTLGFINTSESWPRTFKIKIFLQILLSLSCLAMSFDTDYSDGDFDFDPLALIYMFYSLIWTLSIYLQLFEYRRNLPHAWYGHQLFWSLSCLLSALAFACLFLLTNIADMKTNMPMKVKYIVTHSVLFVVSAGLAWMGFRFKREQPQYTRNFYLANTVTSINEQSVQKR